MITFRGAVKYWEIRTLRNREISKGILFRSVFHFESSMLGVNLTHSKFANVGYGSFSGKLVNESSLELKQDQHSNVEVVLLSSENAQTPPILLRFS
jgi:hypothetical protein